MTDFNSTYNRVVWADIPVADLDSAAVTQVEKNGGQVIQRIHMIGSHGYRAIVLDSEGNRIASHSTVDA